MTEMNTQHGVAEAQNVCPVHNDSSALFNV